MLQKFIKASLLSLLTTFPLTCFSIEVDGQLNETEWQTAQTFDKFTVIKPFTLNKPQYETEARIFSNTEGIYIGFINYQPLSTQNRNKSSRDAIIDADFNRAILDFDGNSINAYSFSIGNGDSIQDGILSDESNYSMDWDGTWYGKTQSDQEKWTAEIFIPWHIAPMQAVDKDIRNIKLHLSRTVASLKKEYAMIPTAASRQRFLSDFKPIQIENHSSKSLDVFAYVSAQQDRIADDDNEDAGLDIFWRPSSNQQLSLTVNPDFGQIESDDLVVNFSAQETFFGEKRPFFTENQGLFDVQSSYGMRLVHTRRIGSTPDVGNSQIADIDAALKWTDNQQNYQYGFFTATEKNGDDYQGKDFFAGRVVHKNEQWNLGYITTFVDRPDLDRTAWVNAVDFDYNVNDKLKIINRLITSSIEQDNISNNGLGLSAKVEYQQNDDLSHSFFLTHFDEDLDVNDMGFAFRTNVNEFYYQLDKNFNDFNQQDPVKTKSLKFNLGYTTNNHGDKHAPEIGVQWREQYKDTSNWFINFNYDFSGINDLITRSNGNLNTEPGGDVFFEYDWGSQANFRIHAGIGYNNYDIGGKGFRYHIHPSYYFSEDFRLEWSIWYKEDNQWLIWQQDNLMGRYDKKQLEYSINFDASLSAQQELRLKFQWISLAANALSSYRVINEQLTTSLDAINDFSFSQSALQVRYRYEIAPLSNFYLAYSRGGYFAEDEFHQPSQLYAEGWQNKDAEYLTAKFRYHF